MSKPNIVCPFVRSTTACARSGRIPRCTLVSLHTTVASSSRLALESIDTKSDRHSRFMSTTIDEAIQAQKTENRRHRGRYIATGAIGIAIISVAYGGYRWWFSLAEWPEPVRTTLRKAIRYRNDHKPVEAEQEFRKAVEQMYTLPPSAFAPDPLHKLTGLHITLASFYTSTNQNLKAYLQLRTAFDEMGRESLSTDPTRRISGPWAGSRPLTHDEYLRAIALAQGLGAAAASVVTGRNRMKYPIPEDVGGGLPQNWEEAAKFYLEGALAALLRLGLQDRSPDEKGPVVVGRDVEIPESRESVDSDVGGKIDKRGMGVTMELLSEMYARQGRQDLAGQLLIQAVSTLLPANTTIPPPLRDRCQAAQMMTSISTYALEPPSTKQIKASRSWSLRALQVANQALEEGGGDPANEAMNSCLRAKATGQYNLGILAEMEKDPRAAIGHLEHALYTARTAGFIEGRHMASEAVKRIQGGS